METVTVVIPTRNEERNIQNVIGEVRKASPHYNILIVDDSDDNKTHVKAVYLGATVLQGQHKGLGQAIVDGLKASDSDVIVVMDADLSHPPMKIPELVEACRDGYEMAVGSRYVTGGSVVGWTLKRKMISWIASAIAYPVTFIKDNTSGYFAVSRSILERTELKPESWKIMLEVLVKTKARVKEIPIEFKDRTEGESKFTFKQVVAYLKHLFKLYLHKYRFIKFGMIGLTGAAIHFPLLYVLTEYAGIHYIVSAILAIVVASTNNYILNNIWTFKHKRQHGWGHILGWFKYQVLSAITDGLYIGLLALFTEIFGIWYMLSAFISLLIVFATKYIVADKIIWNKK